MVSAVKWNAIVEGILNETHDIAIDINRLTPGVLGVGVRCWATRFYY